MNIFYETQPSNSPLISVLVLNSLPQGTLHSSRPALLGFHDPDLIDVGSEDDFIYHLERLAAFI